MKFYFSGLPTTTESDMLLAAGIDCVLTDLFDLDQAKRFPTRAVDSGAYRFFKRGEVLELERWLADAAERIGDTERDFVVMPDVVGDADKTMRRWLAIRELQAAAGGGDTWLHSIIPVWQWGAPIEHLAEMAGSGRRVCVGGLVRKMRDKDEGMLSQLTEICQDFGGSLHILGMNWLKAIERLKDVGASADTSKWLDGARYGHVIFLNTRTGHLAQAPARAIPEYGGLDRAGRCRLCATNLQAFTRETPAELVAA